MTIYDARFLTATIRKDDELEAEPVTVYTNKGQVHLVLDDGTELIFDWAELREATWPTPKIRELPDPFCTCPHCEQLRKAG